ncbi:MAG: S1 RNA-binding domain-containing protein [Candidatus Geothermarchaeota archaeon]
MTQDKDGLPGLGEYVVATVKDVRPYGAYVELDDYKIVGFLPLSEVSSSYVRDIRDHLREGEKIVVKVIRIHQKIKSVDVSLKEVSEKEKERILRKWRRDQRGLKIIEEMAKELNLNYDEVKDKFTLLLSKYPTVYDVLENIIIEPTLLQKIGLVDLEKPILKYLTKKIKPKKYVHETRLKAFYVGKGGSHLIKQKLKELQDKIKKIDERLEVELFNDGTPYYRLRVKSLVPTVLKKRVIPKIAEIVEELKKSINISIVEERSYTTGG